MQACDEDMTAWEPDLCPVWTSAYAQGFQETLKQRMQVLLSCAAACSVACGAAPPWQTRMQGS